MSSLSEPRRPRLLPQNRKLRHLRGLSLRNLSFAPVHLRTADDAAIVGRSPLQQRTKLEALRESGSLHHSRSSGSLRADVGSGLRTSVSDGLPSLLQQVNPSASLAASASTQRPRRTSLSLSAHSSPAARQRRLEEQVDAAVADVFFSLHVDGEAEPVYISEVQERSAVCRHNSRKQKLYSKRMELWRREYTSLT